MSQDAIRFHTIDSDSDLVAVAEVSLFSGVYLRGWYVYRRGGEIEVLPPHKVYQDPVTGEEKVWSILHFESKQTSRQWLERVKDEYLRWSRKGGSIAD